MQSLGQIFVTITADNSQAIINIDKFKTVAEKAAINVTNANKQASLSYSAIASSVGNLSNIIGAHKNAVNSTLASMEKMSYAHRQGIVNAKAELETITALDAALNRQASIKSKVAQASNAALASINAETIAIQKQAHALGLLSSQQLAATRAANPLNEAKKGLIMRSVALNQETRSLEDGMKKLRASGHAAGKALNDAGKHSAFFERNIVSLTKRILVTTVALTAFYGVLRTIKGEFLGGLQAVEDFNMRVASMTSFMVTFSKKAKEGDVAGAFKEALPYAKNLVQVMEILDARTVATGRDLTIMAEGFIKGGVQIDTQNKETLDGFVNIANALKLLTQGQNQEIQMRQEIRGLLQGQSRDANVLFKTLEAIDPQLQKHLEIWKKEGTVIENVGKLLSGFGASAGLLTATWNAVGTTMKTVHDRVLRAAFLPTYNILISKAAEFNKLFIDGQGQMTPLAQRTAAELAKIAESFAKIIIAVAKLANYLPEILRTFHSIGKLLGLGGVIYGGLWASKLAMRGILAFSLLLGQSIVNNASHAKKMNATLMRGAQILMGFGVGLEIGNWLNQFEVVETAAVKFVASLVNGWIYAETGAKVAWAGIKYGFNEAIGKMKDAFAGFLLLIAEGLRLIPHFGDGIADSIVAYANGIEGAVGAEKAFKAEIEEISKKAKERLKVEKEITDALLERAKAKANKGLNANDPFSMKAPELEAPGEEEVNKYIQRLESLQATLEGQAAAFDKGEKVVTRYNRNLATLAELLKLAGEAGIPFEKVIKDLNDKIVKGEIEKLATNLDEFAEKYKIIGGQSPLQKDLAGLNKDFNVSIGLLADMVEMNAVLIEQGSDLAKGLEYFENYNKIMGETRDKYQAGLVKNEIDKIGEIKFDFPGVTSFGDPLADEIGKVVEAMNRLNLAYETQGKAMEELQKKRQGYYDDEFLTFDQKVALVEAVNKKEVELSRDSIRAQIGGYRELFGTTAKLFSEHSRGRKVLSALEKGLAAVEIAMMVKKMAVDSAATAKTVANAGIKALAHGKTAIANALSSVPYPYNLAAAASVVAALAAIGVSISGGGGSSKAPTYASEKGSVLGDPEGVSESTKNGYDLLKDIHATEYKELRGIHDSMRELNNNIKGVVNNIVRNYGNFNNISAGAGGNFLGNTIGKIPSSFTKIADIIGGAKESVFGKDLGGLLRLPTDLLFGTDAKITEWLASGINSVFGGKKKVTASGLSFDSINMGDLLGGGSVGMQQFATIKKDGGWFKKDKYSNQFADVDKSTEMLFTNVFSSMGETMIEISNGLGVDIMEQLKNYNIDIGKVNLKGKTGTEINEIISGIISKTGDQMVSDLFGPLMGQYQKINEGLLETAIRLITEKAVVVDALKRSGHEITGDAIAISQAMIEMAGGLKEFMDATSTYFDKFYTDAEKHKILGDNLGSIFEGMGLSLPKTREEYRKLVESLDVNTEYGQALYVTLMNLSSSADTFFKALEDGEKTFESYANIVNSARVKMGLTSESPFTLGDFSQKYSAMDFNSSSFQANPEQNFKNWLNWFNTIADNQSSLKAFSEILANLGISLDDLVPDLTRVVDSFAEIKKVTVEIDSILGIQGLTDFEISLMNINDKFDSMRQRLIELGSPMENITNLERARQIVIDEAVDKERERIKSLTEKAVAPLFSVLKDYADFVNGMQFTQLAPVQSFEQYQGRFDDLFSQSQGGSVDAIKELMEFTKGEYLPFAQSFLGGSGENYNDFYQSLFGTNGMLRDFSVNLAADKDLEKEALIEAIREGFDGQDMYVTLMLDGQVIADNVAGEINNENPNLIKALINWQSSS